MIKAAIFDLDGTLLDSLGMWEGIDEQFLRRRGFKVPPDYKHAIRSMRFRECAEYTIERFGLNEKPEALMREWDEMAAWEYAHTVRMKPGAFSYLHALKRAGLALGVATIQPRRMSAAALDRHGIRPLFSAVCSTDDVGAGKDRPDVFLHAARLLGASPPECIVFEDSLPALRVAKAAGFAVCAVYDARSRRHWLAARALADATVTDYRRYQLPLTTH